MPQSPERDLTMIDRPNGGFVDPLDRCDFERLSRETTPSPGTSKEPYDEAAGLEYVEEELERQDQERRLEDQEQESDASKWYSECLEKDRRSLATDQTRALVPYQWFYSLSRGRSASQKFGISKNYQSLQSRHSRTADTAAHTSGSGTGARHNSGRGPNLGWSRSVGTQHGEVTLDNRSRTGEGDMSTLNQIQDGMRKLNFGEGGERSTINGGDQDM